ncbi:hypothetical protein H5410_039562 [Solanum commersonii]|uniref:At2g35280-like TPR domain-containing protein n=1 Tax=Solanum commersonii TaxID=4109 RepID=A0A9J5XPL7_SOLCO|nr:hypothetical protein H5410_039562 [Solanum commersonii]
MELCKECGNTEVLHRNGVVDFFKNDRLELAMELLKQPAKESHIGASYMIGIISIFLGGKSRREGSLVEILANIWVKNPLVLGERPAPCTIQHQRRFTKNAWPLDNDDEHVDFHCHACSCDLEIAYIVSILPKH